MAVADGKTIYRIRGDVYWVTSETDDINFLIKEEELKKPKMDSARHVAFSKLMREAEAGYGPPTEMKVRLLNPGW